MFKNIFTKTLYEKRWMTAFWTLGVILMALLMMGFYHSFQQGGYDQILQNLPKSLKGLVGNLASIKTVPGYVSQEVFALRVPLLTLIMGITLFSGLIAGDEAEGTLQTLLTQPVSRLKVYLHKLAAGLVISAIICSGAIIGVLIGLSLIHEHLSLLRLVQATIGVWLLTATFGIVGFVISAISGKRVMAGSLAGLFAFGSYLITSFAPNVSSLSQIDKLSPFHYYNHPSITEFGLKGQNTIIFIGISVIILIIAAVRFIKRDIYQR